MRGNFSIAFRVAVTALLSMGQKDRAFEVGEAHYDKGNDLYKIMLGKYLAYTCGYWKNADNLNDAQEAKLDLVCRKTGLSAGGRWRTEGGAYWHYHEPECVR